MHYILYGDNTHYYAYQLAEGRRYRVYDINDDRGIQAIRTNIKSFAAEKSKKKKMALIFDADTLQEESQAALRRIMEVYAEYISFIFCCQSIHTISDAIQSRCIFLRFPKITTPYTTETYPLDELFHAIESQNVFRAYHIVYDLMYYGYRGDIILQEFVKRYDGIESIASDADRALLDGSDDILQVFHTISRYIEKIETDNCEFKNRE
jgi:DNA polymerase III delta prime subunit